MNKTAAKSGKGGAPKTPKDKSAGSTIKQFMSPGASPRNMEQEAQGGSRMERKGGTEKKTGDKMDYSREDLTTESEMETSRMEERRASTQIPSKGEMSDMLQKMENSIKSEIGLLRADLGSLLERVETTEKKPDELDQELWNLKEQLKTSIQNQKKILYRIEDQENREKRQNIRLRSVPENKGEDLRSIFSIIFGPLLGEGLEDLPKIERIHRVGRLYNSGPSRPRDIVMRFRFYEEKAAILSKMRGKPP